MLIYSSLNLIFSVLYGPWSFLFSLINCYPLPTLALGILVFGFIATTTKVLMKFERANRPYSKILDLTCEDSFSKKEGYLYFVFLQEVRFNFFSIMFMFSSLYIKLILSHYKPLKKSS